jgi:hypothetical protein
MLRVMLGEVAIVWILAACDHHLIPQQGCLGTRVGPFCRAVIAVTVAATVCAVIGGFGLGVIGLCFRILAWSV